MTDPDKIPETDEEIAEALARLKQQGFLPDRSVDNGLREFLATHRGEFRNVLPEVNNMLGDDLRDLIRAQTRRTNQDNFIFRVSVWSLALYIGGALLLLLLAMAHH